MSGAWLSTSVNLCSSMHANSVGDLTTLLPALTTYAVYAGATRRSSPALAAVAVPLPSTPLHSAMQHTGCALLRVSACSFGLQSAFTRWHVLYQAQVGCAVLLGYVMLCLLVLE
jgi:hypothetical protein